jgi:hypothetical protein
VNDPTFIAWSQIIGGILEHANFLSPVSAPKTLPAASGDVGQSDMESLVIEHMNPEHEYDFTELVELSQEHGLFEKLIPTDEKDPKATSKRSKLALYWKKFNGRLFKTNPDPDTDDPPVTLRFVITGKNQRSRHYSATSKLSKNP